MRSVLAKVNLIVLTATTGILIGQPVRAPAADGLQGSSAPSPAPPPRVFLLDAKRLQASRQKISASDPAVSAPLEQLQRDAKRSLTVGPFSVGDKDATPPSGDKHDYMSQAPYFWSD